MVDTIFALATAKGRSAIAVIRISGPKAFGALRALAGDATSGRIAVLRRLRHPASGALLDTALVLSFPAPGSYTGEDVVELQVHGSPAVCRSVCAALAALDGLREAEPGEFTRHALMNGRLDLAQVEGLGDLLVAETAVQQGQALDLMGGSISRRSARWRDDLVLALAHVEASIDFADDDLPEDLLVRVDPILAGVVSDMADALRGSNLAERVREGFEIALVGAPNVGKSTLLNAFAGREAALTSEIAGTTRDVIEVRMDLAGLPVTILDTAGVRDTDDVVEMLGVDRARVRASGADLRIFLVDCPDDAETFNIPVHPDDLVVIAKADLRPLASGAKVSGTTGYGVTDLLERAAGRLQNQAARAGPVSHARQRQAIQVGQAKAQVAIDLLRGGSTLPELAAAEIRSGLQSLDFLVGRVDVEAVLDTVFRNFCLGK